MLNLHNPFRPRVTILLALALLLLPVSVTWDNVAWRIYYGFFHAVILISPLSGKLLGIYTTFAYGDPSWSLLAYAFKLLVTLFLLPPYLRGQSVGPRVGKFVLILLGVSLLTQNFGVLDNLLFSLWYQRPGLPPLPPGLPLPFEVLVGGFLGWVKPGQGAIRLTTFLTIGLASSLLWTWKYSRPSLLLPLPETPVARLGEGRSRLRLMDGFAPLGLSGYLLLLLVSPRIPYLRSPQHLADPRFRRLLRPVQHLTNIPGVR